MLYASRHHPPHIFQNNSIYFLTARTVDQKHYFNTDEKKRLICLCLKAGLQKFKISLYAWVILFNHYHLLAKFMKGEDVSKFINFLNGKSSFELNKLENKRGRKIWYQYCDRCIRNEKDFFTRFNYIHHNPIKHELVASQEKVINYEFCSYRDWLNKKGKGWLMSCFEEYPVIDFTLPEDPESIL